MRAVLSERGVPGHLLGFEEEQDRAGEVFGGGRDAEGKASGEPGKLMNNLKDLWDK